MANHKIVEIGVEITLSGAPMPACAECVRDPNRGNESVAVQWVPGLNVFIHADETVRVPSEFVVDDK